MTTDFTLRLPSDIATLAAEEAARVGISRHEWIVSLITSAVTRNDFDPDIVLGFVRLERGEVDPEALCPTCENPFDDRAVFIGFTAGHIRPEPFGPICEDCATTE
jgi:hypothetical protein